MSSQKIWWLAWFRLWSHLCQRDWLLVSDDLDNLGTFYEPFYWAVLTAGFAVWSLGVSISHVPSPPHDQPFLIWVAGHPWWSAAGGGIITLVSASSTEIDSLALALMWRGVVLSIDALAFALMIISFHNGYSGVWPVLPFAGLFVCSMMVILLTLVLTLISWSVG